MQFKNEQFIHDLSIDTILSVLAQDPWDVGDQSITSALTNDNAKVALDALELSLGENTEGIHAFSDIHFERSVKKILDVGGGKFDCNREYMRRERNIDLLVWDPYNRAHMHNKEVQAAIQSAQADAVTSMSILNVIYEIEVRLQHIQLLKSALVIEGKAYFKVWPGHGPLQGTYLASASKTAFQANAYADRFIREIEVVFGQGNVYLDKTISNLIVAHKVSDFHIPQYEMRAIQHRSKQEYATILKGKEKSMAMLYSKYARSLFFSSKLKFEDQYLIENRHKSPEFQQEYDHRYGLTLY